MDEYSCQYGKTGGYGLHRVALPLWESTTTEDKIDILRDMIDVTNSSYVLGDSMRKITTLEDYALGSPQEVNTVLFMIEMIRKHPDILSRTCEEGHITGSALVIDRTGLSVRILLNHHLALRKWLSFGGHAEWEVSPWQIALREAREESRLPDLYFYLEGSEPKLIDIDVHTVPQRDQYPEHLHLDFRYLLFTRKPGLARPSSESREIKWVTFSEAMELDLEKDLKRFVAKCREVVG
jgi:8-oxo-dGTP pyrophosphatase MutT (NUDIX family)